MLTVLGIVGAALVAWQSYRAFDYLRFRSTLADAYGANLAKAILDDLRELNWSALPQWKENAALYRLLRRKMGRKAAQGIIRAALVDMANDVLSEGDAS